MVEIRQQIFDMVVSAEKSRGEERRESENMEIDRMIHTHKPKSGTHEAKLQWRFYRA